MLDLVSNLSNLVSNLSNLNNTADYLFVWFATQNAIRSGLRKYKAIMIG